RVASGDLVLELVMEQGCISVETGKVVVIDAKLGAGGGFWIEIRVANSDDGALAGDTVNAAVQFIQVRGAIATADTTFHRPAFSGVPSQTGARAATAAKGFIIVVACTQRQGQVVTQAPLVFGKQCPGFLFKIVQSDAVG